MYFYELIIVLMLAKSISCANICSRNVTRAIVHISCSCFLPAEIHNITRETVRLVKYLVIFMITNGNGTAKETNRENIMGFSGYRPQHHIKIPYLYVYVRYCISVKESYAVINPRRSVIQVWVI